MFRGFFHLGIQKFNTEDTENPTAGKEFSSVFFVSSVLNFFRMAS